MKVVVHWPIYLSSLGHGKACPFFWGGMFISRFDSPAVELQTGKEWRLFICTWDPTAGCIVFTSNWYLDAGMSGKSRGAMWTLMRHYARRRSISSLETIFSCQMEPLPNESPQCVPFLKTKSQKNGSPTVKWKIIMLRIIMGILLQLKRIFRKHSTRTT